MWPYMLHYAEYQNLMKKMMFLDLPWYVVLHYCVYWMMKNTMTCTSGWRCSLLVFCCWSGITKYFRILMMSCDVKYQYHNLVTHLSFLFGMVCLWYIFKYKELKSQATNVITKAIQIIQFVQTIFIESSAFIYFLIIFKRMFIVFSRACHVGTHCREICDRSQSLDRLKFRFDLLPGAFSDL